MKDDDNHGLFRRQIATDVPAAKVAVRNVVGVGVMLAIASFQIFRVGSYLDGSLLTLYHSFAEDIIMPFGMYFILFLTDARLKFLRPWYVKGLLIFGMSSLTEVMQAFGVHLLGVTFDPLDFVMFAVGVLLAILADRLLLARFLPLWSLETKP